MRLTDAIAIPGHSLIRWCQASHSPMVKALIMSSLVLGYGVARADVELDTGADSGVESGAKSGTEIGAGGAAHIETNPGETTSGGSHTGHAFERHDTIGIFIGDTTENRREGFTLGLEYEHRLTESLGLGFTAEHVAGDFDTNVFVLPVALHRNYWKFYAGPGLEFVEGSEEVLFRVGAEYGFHFDRLEVSPQVDLDFVDGERLFVFGVVIAIEL